MPSLESLRQWLTGNEALFSALAALVALVGVSYGVMRFILQPVFKRAGSASPIPASSSTETTTDTSSLADPTTKPAIPSDIADDHVSLAVLTFTALSSNEDDKYIAAGIASEIIALITPVADIRVSSRATTYNWQSDDVDAKQAAIQVNARFALTGSIRMAGDRMRVIATLTDQSSDSIIWTETYLKQLDDLFEVQFDIARSIVGATLGQVRLTESMLATRKPDHQLDAWGLLQKGYYFWLTDYTVENVLKATHYLRKAIGIEPDYAAARASLGMLLSQLTTSRVCEDYDAVFAEAKHEAEEAFRLRPNDADVLESVGVAFQNTGQGKRAVKVLRRAVEVAPLNLISRGYLAMTLAFTGGTEGATEARALLKENFRIAPHHPSAAWWHFFMAIADQALGDYESSRIHCEKNLQGQHAWVHTYFFLANALCEMGNTDEAGHHLAAARDLNPAYSLELYIKNLVLITGSESLASAFHKGLDKLESQPELIPKTGN